MLLVILQKEQSINNLVYSKYKKGKIDILPFFCKLRTREIFLARNAHLLQRSKIFITTNTHLHKTPAERHALDCKKYVAP